MSDQTNTTYEKDGLVYTLPGIEYQVKLSVLLIKRALNKNYRFRIAAERKDAGKFDDLEIEILNTSKHRLYQLKHLDDATKHITTGDLENMKDGRFSIPKYFTSYRQIKETSESSGMSHEFVIYTNVGLEKKLRENFEDIGKDELLDMKEHKITSELLKLKQVCSFREQLKQLLKNTSDLEQIKTKLIDCIENAKVIDFKDKILKKYQETLVKTVLDISNKKIYREFLNSDFNLSEGAKELRLCLLDKFKKTIFDRIITVKPCIDLRKTTKSEVVNLPNDKIENKEIQDFLDKLILAVNQPSETELNAIIEKTMGKDRDINLLDNRFVANEILCKMMEWTKQKEGSYLTQKEGKSMFKSVREMISKLVLIGPTKDHCKQLESFGVSFRSTPAGAKLEEFLESKEQQILHLKNSYKPVFSSIKVYQTLKSLCQYSKDDSYMFAPLKTLQRIRRQVLEAFESNDLLIIEFSTSGDEMDELFASDISEILSDNNHKKLILISNDRNRLPEELLDSILTVEDDSNSFIDLSKASQGEILSTKKVSFQGYMTPIGRDLKHCIDKEILFRIMTNDKLEIGSKLPDLGDIEKYYVARELKQIVISNTIFQASEFQVTHDSLVSNVTSDQDILLISDNGNDFETLCNRYSEHSIHWIRKTGEAFVWENSFGSNLTKLRKYITSYEHDVSCPLPIHFRRQFNDLKNKVVIIADQPGMGKSTKLTVLAKEFKKTYPSFWVLRINLIDCSTMLTEQTHQFDQEEAMSFLHKVLSVTTDENIRLLERKWFDKCFDKGNVIILFDGFDEISPDYKDKVLQLLKTLKETNVHQLWISTRPYKICTELEDQLLAFSHSFLPLDSNQKRMFLSKLLEHKFDHVRAGQFAEQLILRFSKFELHRYGDFLGNPLQLKMIATVFLDAVNSNDTSLQSKFLTDTNGHIDLAGLYQKFFDIIFNDYIKNKNPKLYESRNDPNTVKIIKEKRKRYEESYKRMGLYALFGKDEFERLLPEPEDFANLQADIKEIDVGSHKMGIIDRVIDNKLIFVHQTYAEFFLALFLTTESVWGNPHFKKFLINRIFATVGENKISNFFVFSMGKNDNYRANFPIHAAVFRNDKSDIEQMLAKRHYECTTDTLLGWSPLQYAIQFKFGSIVIIFFENGAKISDLIENIESSHDLNTTFNKIKVICARILVELNLIGDCDGNRDLYLSIENDSLEVMKHLMDSTMRENKELSFLPGFKTIVLQVLKYLLETFQSDPNSRNSCKEAAIVIATKFYLTAIEFIFSVEYIDFKIMEDCGRKLLNEAVTNGVQNTQKKQNTLVKLLLRLILVCQGGCTDYHETSGSHSILSKAETVVGLEKLVLTEPQQKPSATNWLQLFAAVASNLSSTIASTSLSNNNK